MQRLTFISFLFPPCTNATVLEPKKTFCYPYVGGRHIHLQLIFIFYF